MVQGQRGFSAFFPIKIVIFYDNHFQMIMHFIILNIILLNEGFRTIICHFL